MRVSTKIACGLLATSVLAGIAVPSLASPGTPSATGRTVVVGERSSVVRAHALGDAARNKSAENRWFSHSDLQPTGRFVRAGDQLTVTVPASAPTLELSTGLIGPHSGMNGGKDVALVTKSLEAGQNRVTADVDGMVYIKNRATSGDVTVEVAGGQPVPTYVEGETEAKDFTEQLARWTTAPFVELVGDRIFGDFQSSIVRPALAGRDVEAVVDLWDKAVTLTDKTYGFDTGAAGRAHRYGQRIFIANADTGSGWANATNGRLQFHGSAGAEVIKYAAKDQWGLFHEIGHTYQPRELRWSGMTEVTVNISSAAVQEAFGLPNRLDDNATRSKLADFRKTPVGQRSFESIADPFVKVLMFDQLRRAFGDDFYARLAQEFRLATEFGKAPAGDDVSLKQNFAVKAATVADRDLTTFFAQWGFALTPETRDHLATLPKPTTEFWNNHDRPTDVIENQLDDYVLPTGELTVTAPSVNLGRQTADESEYTVSKLGNVSGRGSARVVDALVDAGSLGAGAGRLTVVLESDRGVRDVISDTVDVTPGTMLQFNGIDRGSKAVSYAQVALDARSSTLRTNASSYSVHPNFANEDYFGMAILAPNGRVIRSEVVQGHETAQAMAAAFQGYSYQEGQIVMIRHEEASNRFLRFAEDVQQGRVSDKSQAFRITDHRLVPITPTQIPSCPGDCAPTASAAPETVQGSMLAIDGTRFIPGERVILSSPELKLSKTATAGADGTVAFSTFVASDAAPGRVSIELEGKSSLATAEASTTITEKDDEVSPPGGSCGVPTA